MLTAQRAVRVFNGRYTLKSPTGQHRTFMIKTQPDNSSFCPGKRVVALLTGPDNESSYRSFAFMDDNGIHVWRKYRCIPGQEPTVWERYAQMLWQMATNPASTYHQRGAEILIEGRCCRCNRALTHPDSIETGIGPECAKIMANAG